MAGQGPVAFVGQTLPDGVFAAIDNGGAATMKAMAEGRANPVNRKAATQADFDELTAAMRSAGISDPGFAAMANQNVETEDCKAVVAMYNAALTLEGDSGERTRSYIVDLLAATP